MAALNLSLCRLLLGDYSRGWCDYDQFDALSIYPPISGIKVNSTDALLNSPSPILVWHEQGIGDSIMFARYLLLLDSLNISWIFACPSSLVSLMRDWLNCSGPIVDIRHLNSYEGSNHTPLLSLPYLLSTNLSTIPAYLPVYRQPFDCPSHLQVHKNGYSLSIGLVWASDPGNHKLYPRKSIPFSLLYPTLADLSKLDLATFHSLQFGDDARCIDTYKDFPIVDWSTSLTSFSDTAFVLNQLDLVITVDTAVAHLSASLGRPTWLLLPANSDFRWLTKTPFSPWYPECMRLFRQSSAGDWDSVIQQLDSALNTLFQLKLTEVASANMPS